MPIRPQRSWIKNQNKIKQNNSFLVVPHLFTNYFCSWPSNEALQWKSPAGGGRSHWKHSRVRVHCQLHLPANLGADFSMAGLAFKCSHMTGNCLQKSGKSAPSVEGEPWSGICPVSDFCTFDLVHYASQHTCSYVVFMTVSKKPPAARP